jgi:hypothetical protein
MAVDNRQQGQLTGLGYDHMRYATPHFTNPWVSTPSTSSQLYPTSSADNSQQQQSRPTNVSIPPYTGLPVTAAPLGAGISLPVGLYDAQNLLDPQDALNTSRAYTSNYAAAAASPNATTYAPTSAPQYAMDYQNRSPYGYQSDSSRRSSHPSVSSVSLVDPALETRSRQSSIVDFDRLSNASQRSSFSDALDASRGMVAMSQNMNDLTPRNIYGGGGRNSTDSYGFPSTHSAHSSISNASSSYPSYYSSGSVGDASSVTDYSSASESVDLNSRTLPRPSSLVAQQMPPAPQSMMGQFSSKVSSSSQKKHKCKICDKRFTRPSSLQTHMYSHTGEKRKFPYIPKFHERREKRGIFFHDY